MIISIYLKFQIRPLFTKIMLRPCYHNIICLLYSLAYWNKLFRQLSGHFLDHLYNLLFFKSEFSSCLLYTVLLSWWSTSLFLLVQESFCSDYWTFWRACMHCCCQLKSVKSSLVNSSTAWQEIWHESSILQFFLYICSE